MMKRVEVSSEELLKEISSIETPSGQVASTTGKLDPNLFWSPELVMYLCTGILILCLATMTLSTWVLKSQGVGATQLLKLFAVLSIINMAAIVIIAGYGQEQVAPIMGLFGAIAGYLLGKDGQTVQNQAAHDAKEPS